MMGRSQEQIAMNLWLMLNRHQESPCRLSERDQGLCRAMERVFSWELQPSFAYFDSRPLESEILFVLEAKREKT